MRQKISILFIILKELLKEGIYMSKGGNLRGGVTSYESLRMEAGSSCLYFGMGSNTGI